MKWFRNGFFCRPSQVNPMVEHGLANLVFNQPSMQDLAYAIDSNDAISAHIEMLFCGCCPSAVKRAVWSVIVNAVQFQRRIAWYSHILHKQFKRLNPTGAYRNATASIVRKAWIFWTETSTLHVCPHVIDMCMGHAVRKASRAKDFPVIASAAFCLLAQDVIAGCDNLVPAVAAARNHPDAVLLPSKTQDCQSLEFPANDVCENSTSRFCFHNNTVSNADSFDKKKAVALFICEVI